MAENIYVTPKRWVDHYVEILYNRQRLHGALGFYSPVDFENNLNQNINNPALRLALGTNSSVLCVEPA